MAEYWIIDTVAEAVELYRLDGRIYPAVPKQTEGILSSDVVPGFELPVRAIFDEAENADVDAADLGTKVIDAAAPESVFFSGHLKPAS